MQAHEIRRRIEEYIFHKGTDEALGKSMLETALYLEDACGFALADKQISEGNLGTASSLRQFVKQETSQ